MSALARSPEVARAEREAELAARIAAARSDLHHLRENTAACERRLHDALHTTARRQELRRIVAGMLFVPLVVIPGFALTAALVQLFGR
jgi:hypothetical protein